MSNVRIRACFGLVVSSVGNTEYLFLYLLKPKIMEDTGVIKTSVSMPTQLWNEVRKVIDNDDLMSFSRWVQSASRIKLKQIKMQNVDDFYNSLDKECKEMLLKRIKKGA